jgi:hypothetical protein
MEDRVVHKNKGIFSREFYCCTTRLRSYICALLHKSVNPAVPTNTNEGCLIHHGRLKVKHCQKLELRLKLESVLNYFEHREFK